MPYRLAVSPLKVNLATDVLAVIALGSNISDRLQNLSHARWMLSTWGTLVASSPIYETFPWGVEEQEKFLNAALVLKTRLTPEQLLEKMQEIEISAKRIRSVPNGPRSLDLDLLFYENTILETPYLVLPHPRMAERDFVLRPVCDVLPDFVHPILNRTMQDLLKTAGIRTLTGNVFDWDGSSINRMV